LGGAGASLSGDATALAADASLSDAALSFFSDALGLRFLTIARNSSSWLNVGNTDIRLQWRLLEDALKIMILSILNLLNRCFRAVLASTQYF
jgi:hypothetical protein